MPQKSKNSIPWLEKEEKDFNLNNWKVRSSADKVKTSKTLYYCQNKKGLNCPAQLRKDVHIATGQVSFFQAYEHVAECSKNLNLSKISPRSEIIKLYDNGLHTAWEIKKNLEVRTTLEGQKLFDEINLQYVYNVIHTKKMKDVKAIKNVGTANVANAIANMPFTGNNETPYILNSILRPVQILMSSKKLLSKLINAEFIHLDATYKLTTCNYPIINFGFSDLQGSFFLVAMGIVETESTDSYTWFLDTIKSECLKFNPKVFIADNSL